MIHYDGANVQREIPPPGSLIVRQHKVWRVIEINPRPADLWSDRDRERVAAQGEQYAPVAVVLRPVHITSTDPKARSHDRHACSWKGGHHWHVFRSEHYPVCGQCREPLPCRDQLAAREAERAMKRMNRYTIPGVCPSCEQPVTIRTKVRTFDDNLEMPGGPPVTFHIGRSNCRADAADYEKRWVQLDPANRRTELSCPGTVTRHNDKTYECTEDRACRGPIAFHPVYQSCTDRACCAGVFDCHPWPDDTLRECRIA